MSELTSEQRKENRAYLHRALNAAVFGIPPEELPDLHERLSELNVDADLAWEVVQVLIEYFHTKEGYDLKEWRINGTRSWAINEAIKRRLEDD